jgi:hypothetical protein
MATLSQHYPVATAAAKEASGKGKGKAAAVAAPPAADADEQAQAELMAFDLDSVRGAACGGRVARACAPAESRGLHRR